MCDFSGKLIAWLDRELPASEAADVERHVRDLRGVPEPASDAYRKVSARIRRLLR